MTFTPVPGSPIVEFASGPDKDPVFVNAALVRQITRFGDNSASIHFDENHHSVVNEPPDKAAQKIANALSRLPAG